MKRLVVLLLFALSACEDEPPVDDDPMTCDEGYDLIDEECLDQTAPVITASGDDVILAHIGDPLPLYVVDVEDVDPDTTVLISGYSDIDMTTTGTYHVYINAVDTSGNIADEVTKTIHVIKNPPAIMVSFASEYIDSVTIRVTTFGNVDDMESLSIHLYEGTNIVATKEYESDVEYYQFDGLPANVNYDVQVIGTYESGSRLGIIAFQKNSITVGTYRTLDASYEEYTTSTEHFQLLQRLVYLPFDPSNDTKSEDMIKRLARVDYDILNELATRIGAIIFVNNHVSDVPEYADFAQADIIPYIAGAPSVLQIDYHGTSIDITTQMIGMLIAGSYLPMIDLTTYWTDIYDAEAEGMFPTTRYSDSAFDFFIECVAYYYYSDDSRATLLENAPEAHDFIASLQDIYDGELYTDWEDMIVIPE